MHLHPPTHPRSHTSPPTPPNPCSPLQMTLEEYEAVLAEKRAGLNQQREAAFKADEKQVRA